MPEKRKVNIFNLKRRIEEMSFQYHHIKTLLLGIVVIVVAIAIGYFYKMMWQYAAVLAVFFIVLLPGFILRHYKRKYQDKRLSDASGYMEQILYAFKNTPKIYDALLDVQELFESGEIRSCIDRAIHVIEHGEYSTEDRELDLNHAALAYIENCYQNDRLKNIHDFICEVDKNGGEYETSIDLLLTDRNGWVKNTEKHQKDMSISGRNVIISAIIILVCSAIPNYMISGMLPSDMNIGSYPFYNIATLIALMLLAVIMRVADKRMTRDLLNPAYSVKQKDMRKLYLNTVSWDKKKERKASFLYAVIPFVLLIICAVNHITWGIVGCVLLIVFMLNQHIIGHSLNVKNARKYIEMEFPRWLLKISLHLQTDSVKVAVRNSLTDAPEILVPALEELVQRLEENPESPEPFLDFMRYFNIPEIKSAMKMLYSISSSGAGDIQEQISAIVDRTNDMLLKADEMRNKDEEAGMFALMFSPSISMIIIFLVGIVIFVMAFFSTSLI